MERFTRARDVTTLLRPSMFARTHKIFALRLMAPCLALSVFPAATMAQSSAASSASARATQLSPSQKTTEPGAKNPAAPITIEFYSLKVRLENDGTGTRQLDVRVKAGTDEGVGELKTLSFDYDSANEKVALVYLRVIKPNGGTVEVKPEALTDGLAPAVKDAPAFSELREAHIDVPAMAPGDTLTYEFTTTIIQPPAPGEFWFSHNFLSVRPALDEELEVNVPAARAIHIQTAPSFSPQISTSGDRKIYLWKRLNAAPVAGSPEEPTKPRDVVLTTFADWDALAKWLVAMEGGVAASSGDLTSKSQTLIADQQNDAKKIEVVYDFVAKQIHLARIPPEQANFQIHDAAKVLSAGYGDELDKCALLTAMLNADGFKASIALVPSGEKFDPDVPWPGAIGHAVVHVTSGKDTFWMDPSADTLPFELLLPNSRGKNVLIVSAGTAPSFAKTPVDPPFPSTQDVDITGDVTSLGKLTARVRYTLRGDNEFELRTAFERTPQSEWKSVAQTMASIDGLHGTVTSVTPSDVTDTRNPFTLNFVLVSQDFLDWSRPRLVLPLLLPAFGMPDAPQDAAKPIDLGSPLTVTAKLTLNLPANDSPHMPVGAGVKRDYAEYRSAYSAQEHSITAQRTLRFISRELPASSRSDYQAFSAAVQADESQGLVVDNITPGVPAEATAPELMQSGAAEMKDQHFGNALLLFQQVEQLNPKQANLWLSLGTAQLQMGKYDDAIASFQKQTQANPKDENVNNLLGVAFYDEKKYDEAEAAFKKQIELKPLDKEAYTDLGAVYIDEKEFDKAHAQLEKAEVLDPDSAAVRIRLGQAELGLGKTEDALADFEKASTTSPSPLVANDIAYALAENKVALARAKEYADAAIGPTENSLSEIDLQHFTVNNIVSMNALPAFWDTLGWIYFQEGKVAEAKPLVEAAWRLNQVSDTGDHLARIYAASGQKELAIRTYEEALAAGTASADTRERLKKLLGPAATNASIDAGAKRAVADLMRERTVALGGATVSGRAEVLVLVASGATGPTVRDARFLAGDDKLASVTEHVRKASFPAILPHGSHARIVLRAAVECSAKAAKCELLFDRPRDLLAGAN